MQDTKIKVEWAGSCLPAGWHFIVLEGALQATGGEMSSTVLPGCGTCVLQYQPPRQDTSTLATEQDCLVGMGVGKPITSRLDLRSASTGRNSCLVQTWPKAHGWTLEGTYYWCVANWTSWQTAKEQGWWRHNITMFKAELYNVLRISQFWVQSSALNRTLQEEQEDC